jgi:hypothetical protein
MPPKHKKKLSSTNSSPKEKHLRGKNMEELRSLAKSNGIKGYSSMNKSELIPFLCSRLSVKTIRGGSGPPPTLVFNNILNKVVSGMHGTLVRNLYEYVGDFKVINKYLHLRGNITHEPILSFEDDNKWGKEEKGEETTAPPLEFEYLHTIENVLHVATMEYAPIHMYQKTLRGLPLPLIIGYWDKKRSDNMFIFHSIRELDEGYVWGVGPNEAAIIKEKSGIETIKAGEIIKYKKK